MSVLVTRAAAFGSSSAFDNVFDEPPGDMDEYGEVGRGPAVTSEIIRRDRGGKVGHSSDEFKVFEAPCSLRRLITWGRLRTRKRRN